MTGKREKTMSCEEAATLYMRGCTKISQDNTKAALTDFRIIAKHLQVTVQELKTDRAAANQYVKKLGETLRERLSEKHEEKRGE